MASRIRLAAIKLSRDSLPTYHRDEYAEAEIIMSPFLVPERLIGAYDAQCRAVSIELRYLDRENPGDLEATPDERLAVQWGEDSGRLLGLHLDVSEEDPWCHFAERISEASGAIMVSDDLPPQIRRSIEIAKCDVLSRANDIEQALCETMVSPSVQASRTEPRAKSSV